MGLAFKPDIDDLRESPAVIVARELINDSSVETLMVEPNIESHPEFEISSIERAVDQADLVVLLVRHKQFVTLEMNKEILDFCGYLR